jgi:hypothetical protein
MDTRFQDETISQTGDKYISNKESETCEKTVEAAEMF